MIEGFVCEICSPDPESLACINMIFKNSIALYFYVIIILGMLHSCLDRKFIEGRSELVSGSDTTINDLSVFTGKVYKIDEGGGHGYPESNTEVRMEHSVLISETDSHGGYILKVMPGTYTLQCNRKGNRYAGLIEEFKNVKIDINEKVRVNFYLGTTIE